MNRAITLILVISLFLSTSNSFAQKSKKPFHQGVWLAQVNIGLISGFYGNVIVPPINFAIEKAHNNEFAYGLFGGYASSRDEYTFLGEKYGWEYSYFILAGSVSYHPDIDVKNVDVYGRAFLGYVFVSESSFGTYYYTVTARGSFATYGTYVGVTYFLSPKFGVQGEVGYGNIAILRFGITLLLK
jgi:hypothetical protein